MADTTAKNTKKVPTTESLNKQANRANRLLSRMANDTLNFDRRLTRLMFTGVKFRVIEN